MSLTRDLFQIRSRGMQGRVFGSGSLRPFGTSLGWEERAEFYDTFQSFRIDDGQYERLLPVRFTCLGENKKQNEGVRSHRP